MVQKKKSAIMGWMLLSLGVLLMPVHALRAEPANSLETAHYEAQMVNLNTADLNELEQVNGIGKVLAQRIIEYRDLNGPFESMEELIEVKGIGKAKYAKLKQHFVL